MELGQFSLSLAVKDINQSYKFYQTLGFTPLDGCGSVDEKWLILKKDAVVIGLFEGMFDDNILTFNPADARAIQSDLERQNIAIEKPCTGEKGATHFTVVDPDGNRLMFDQF